MTGRSLRMGRVAVTAAMCVGAVCLPQMANAATVPNLTYTQAELEKPISFYGGDGAGKFPSGPGGSNTALILHGYMIVMGSFDSGKPPGSFHTYDISDPRTPVLKHTLDGTPETSKIRELHAMPIAMIDGKDFLVVPTTVGLQFFDFTDPLAPKPSGSITLSGVNGGDYDNAAWVVSWQWPYVFAGGTGNGVYIVDATDPAHPVEVTPHITSPEVGNFRVGPVYAAGNDLVVAQMDQGTTHFSVLDVSDVKKPFLLATGQTSNSLYSSLVIGDRIYGPGADGTYSFMKWSETAITQIHSDKSGTDRGGYCGYTDGFLICGQSKEGYKKWDVRDEAKIVQVGHGTDPEATGGDFDFATAVGNLVYLGNDHGSGAALIPHQMAPDTTPPKVLKIFPNEGTQKLPLTTRFTVYFSDDIDLDTVNPKNIIVRKNGECTPLAGNFSKSSFNAISFGTKAPLVANATYDVVVPAGGIKDLAGNAIAAGSIAHFSTGTTLDAVMACDGDGAVVPGGGSGGTGAGGGAGAPGTAGSAGATTAGGAGGAAGSGGTAGTSVVPAAGAPAGGMAGTAGSTGGTTTEPPVAADPAGCGCTVPGRAPAGAASLLLAGLALLGNRRARARRRGERSGQA
jgi:Bacterial Ig-like domain